MPQVNIFNDTERDQYEMGDSGSKGISRDIRLMNLIQRDQACVDLDVRVGRRRRRRRFVKISWLGYLSRDRSFHAREIYQEFEAWILFWKDWRIVWWKVACAYGPCIFALIKSRENTFNLFFFSSSIFFFFHFLFSSLLPANFSEKSRRKGVLD